MYPGAGLCSGRRFRFSGSHCLGFDLFKVEKSQCYKVSNCGVCLCVCWSLCCAVQLSMVCIVQAISLEDKLCWSFGQICVNVWLMHMVSLIATHFQGQNGSACQLYCDQSSYVTSVAHTVLYNNKTVYDFLPLAFFIISKLPPCVDTHRKLCNFPCQKQTDVAQAHKWFPGLYKK